MARISYDPTSLRTCTVLPSAFGQALMRLRDIMIRSRKLGYGSYAMGMVYGKLKNNYPKAHEAFEEELSG